MLKLFLLGAFQVEVDGLTLPDSSWTRRKAKNLLKLLALQPHHQLHLERAADLLCPELNPVAARRDLYRSLHTLRHILEPQLNKPSHSRFIAISQKVIRLQGQPDCWIDLVQFEKLIEQAKIAADPSAPLEEAVQLYRGELLEADLYEEWTVLPREQARANFEATLFRLAQIESETPRPDYVRAIANLERLLRLEPTHEAAHRLLMQVYARAGLRQQAIQQFQHCVQVLDDELSLEPEAATLDLYRQLLSGELTAAPTDNPPDQAKASRPFLPVTATPLVGREQAVADLKDLLLQPAVRLVSVTGAGGVGKSHLALEVANQLRVDFKGNVTLVELAAIRDPQLVLTTIAQTLGLRDVNEPGAIRSLQDYLHERRWLLVLDNFEQVLVAAPRLSELLSSVPGLKLLVTSRAALHLSGEHEMSLPPLALPDQLHLSSLGELAAIPAVALFVQRGQAVRPAFRLSAENAPAVAEICIRLSGIPLALELAAARLKIFDPPLLLERLAHSLDLLTNGPHDRPARQRTLRDTLVWSDELLNEAERHLFYRLAIFSGEYRLETAQAVCLKKENDFAALADPAYFLDTLTGLVDYNLVRRLESAGQSPRFTMFDTIREYALEKLSQQGEELYWRQSYTDYLLEIGEKVVLKGWDTYKGFWLSQLLEQEQSTILTTLDRLLDHSSGQTRRLAGRLAAVVWRYWWQSGLLSEGRRRLEQLVAGLEQEPAQSPSDQAALWLILARLQHGIGQLAWSEGYSDEAIRAYEKSLAWWHKLPANEDDGQAETLGSLAYAVGLQGHYARFQALQAAATKIWLARQNDKALNISVYNHGVVLLHQAEPAKAYPYFWQSLQLSLHTGEPWGMDLALSRCVRFDAQPSALAELQTLYHQSLADHRYRHSELKTIGSILTGLAILHEYAGEYRQALNYYCEALAIYQKTFESFATNNLMQRQAWLYLKWDNLAQAEYSFSQNLRLAQEFKNFTIRADIANGLAWVNLHNSKLGQAVEWWQASLNWCRELAEPDTLASCLEGLAGLAARTGDFANHPLWSGAADALRQSNQAVQLYPASRFLYQPYLPDLPMSRQQLGQVEFDKQWQKGRQLIDPPPTPESRLLIPQYLYQIAQAYLSKLKTSMLRPDITLPIYS